MLGEEATDAFKRHLYDALTLTTEHAEEDEVVVEIHTEVILRGPDGRHVIEIDTDV